MNRNEEKSGFGFRDEHPVSETLIFRLIATDSLCTRIWILRIFVMKSK
jgi:hypothetical protein